MGYLLAIPRSSEMKEEKDFALDGLEFVVSLLAVCSNFFNQCQLIPGRTSHTNVIKAGSLCGYLE